MADTLRMTAGRRAALAIGVPLVLAIFGWTALSGVALVGQGSYPVRLHVPVRGDHASLLLGDADIRLRPGPAGRLTLTGTARYALIKSRVSWAQAASGVRVTSDCHQITGQCSFSYDATVPPVGELTVRDSDANVTLTALVNRGLSVTNTNGDITGTGLAASRLQVANSSGNVTLPGLVTPDVTVRNSDGDVTITFTKVPGSVRISDASGDVHLVLPHGPTAYRVSVSTPSGSNTVRVPTNPASRHVITVTDPDGDVSITQ